MRADSRVLWVKHSERCLGGLPLGCFLGAFPTRHYLSHAVLKRIKLQFRNILQYRERSDLDAHALFQDHEFLRKNANAQKWSHSYAR